VNEGARTSDDDLAEQVAGWSPPAQRVSETLSDGPARALLALLPPDTPSWEGERLPMLWHYVYFQRWPALSELGPDGHPAGGGFFPPIRDRRRMFAGGRCVVKDALRIGSEAVSTSEVVAQKVKQGRTGALLFVTVRTRIEQAGRECVVEEQDLVYRSGEGNADARRPSPGAEQPPAQGARADHQYAYREPRTFDPTVLFRFSAATANSHRIHYDRPYALDVEHFPGLLVQGPLLVLSMAELLRRHGAPPEGRIDYRLKRPVFADRAVELVLDSPTVPRRTAVLAPDGTEHATAVFDPEGR
jgi:3-methylfumaryl-CoA hydratase